jgi:hypothetical protein
MARENQGLQIALIVFVMLTIILGVTTYLFFQQYGEADLKAKSNSAKCDEQTKRAIKAEDDVKELKRQIGLANTDKVDANFNDDMKKFGGSYPEDVRFYRPLLDKMAKTIDEKNIELEQTKAKLAKLETDFAAREANKQPQIDEFKKAAESAGKDLADERTKYNSDRERITQAEIKLQADFDNARKDAKDELRRAELQLEEAKKQGRKLVLVNKSLSGKLDEVTATKFEVPSGEIRWINQRSGVAWINLGHADSLHRQITFGVYPSSTSDMSTGGKKGSIEITQVLGDHLAEARVFDDKLSDPIMPGDKIYTPVWIPGEKRHFALAGFMDPNGEDRNNIQAVKDIITTNGGVVDCYLDEKGRQIGNMSVNTRFLVLGEAPNERGQAAMIAGFTKMQKEAEGLGIQKIQLADMLQRMGWKNRTPIIHFGRNVNPKEFAPKSEDRPRKSTGSVSEVFQPRQPPARVQTGAY